MANCEYCNDTGAGYFSCCTGEVVDTDYPLCPECYEHLGEEECICKQENIKT